MTITSRNPHKIEQLLTKTTKPTKNNEPEKRNKHLGEIKIDEYLWVVEEQQLWCPWPNLLGFAFQVLEEKR